MKFSCIVIDDDLHTIEQFVEYIGYMPELRLLKAYSNPVTALAEINKLEQRIDFLFTDVEMPQMNGLELASLIITRVNCLVLVSGHLHHAMDGYAINAKYFLHKPFNLKKFEGVIKGLISRLLPENPFIMVKLSGKNQILKLYIDDIIMIEGASNYIKIHTANKIYVPYGKMANMEKELQPYNFLIRISRSFIISSKHVEKIEGYIVRLKNNLVVSVGKSYYQSFDEFFERLVKDGNTNISNNKQFFTAP
ncbi:LytR/AlgR family response regulator transcription factor [Pedobacter sandarakinus]|uniref:LytR/AlgR family response regulator transcription factor n=1 Tax=Pedobacter sandarakinus TaxID=353156 RepID=UPI002247AF37|nr:LytTR family DNA-binding domain-containing protein [Pedobacter sandarakinus]MCX2576124.1 LytTR family DNA-binding domain-containing protein [Pedobacter sandarakinus]